VPCAPVVRPLQDDEHDSQGHVGDDEEAGATADGPHGAILASGLVGSLRRWKADGTERRALSGRPMAPAYESDSPTSIRWSPASRRGRVATLAITSRTSLTRGSSNSAPGETAPFAEGRAPINAQAASTGRNRCSSAAGGRAPTTRSISCPSRITTSNGIDCAPNLVASPGFVSTSTFTTFRRPA
jgi:hypothetical protein